MAKVTGTTVNYYHGDSEGNTRLVSSSTGTVLFADNYLPFGQDNGTPTGSETYKFIGKPWSSAIGLYYDYQRWYDPSTGRFVSPDPSTGDFFAPQSLNAYVYGLNSALMYEDRDGASPTRCPIYSWACFLGQASVGVPLFFYIVTDNFHGKLTIGPGTLRVNPSPHQIWVGSKINANGDSLVKSKLDRPDFGQPSKYTLNLGDEHGEWNPHIKLPDTLGEGLDTLFSHAGKASIDLGVVGIIATGIDIYSACQQGNIQCDQEIVRQGFSWGGAIAGAELGAAIGTAIFPGVGTIIGGLLFGAIGAWGGDQLANQFFNTPLPGFIYYPTPTYGRNRMTPE